MELRQLALFLMACQFGNHAGAAQAAGVSRSTLSEATSALEAELGLQLFRRSGRATVTGPAGRWLFQEAADLLCLTEALGRFQGAARPLRIVSPLRFMFGRLYRASLAAARALNAENPAILPRVRFASPYAAGLDLAGDPEDADVRLAYAGGAVAGDAFLFEDEWVAVEGGGAQSRPPVIWLPQLPEGEAMRIRDYCRRNGLPDPTPVEEDVGVFARLRQARERTWLLAPRSLVAHGVAQGALPVHPLEPQLTSPVTARITARNPETIAAARAFIDHLTVRIGQAPPPEHFTPDIALRDLLAVAMLARTGNTTRAARQLNMTQPALSSALARVEEGLGHLLFQRHSRGVTPSHPALDLIVLAAGRASAILTEARNVALQERQEVWLGHSAAAMLCPEIAARVATALAEWRGLMPNTNLRLIEAPARRLEAMLRAGELGIAIMDAPEGGSPGQGLCPLGPLMVVGADPDPQKLVLPAEDEGIAMAAPGLRAPIQGASLPLCVSLARAHGAATVLPERLYLSLAPELPARALTPRAAMVLRTAATTGRSLGEAEQLLLSSLRRSFREKRQAASAR